MNQQTPITEFQGEYRFLSNFWPAEVEYEGDIYPSVEHAYQAAKSTDRLGRAMIQRADTAGKAKRLGRHLILRKDWEQAKLPIMLLLVTRKFSKEFHPDLVKKLLATGERELIEGNTWGDVYWGVCNGKGENKLGKCLMTVRRALLEEP